MASCINLSEGADMMAFIADGKPTPYPLRYAVPRQGHPGVHMALDVVP